MRSLLGCTAFLKVVQEFEKYEEESAGELPESRSTTPSAESRPILRERMYIQA
jgi:hypothetical protein